MGSSTRRADTRFAELVRALDLVVQAAMIAGIVACVGYLLTDTTFNKPPLPVLQAASSNRAEAHIVHLRYELADRGSRPSVRAVHLTFDREPTSLAVSVETDDRPTGVAATCELSEVEARCEFVELVALEDLERLIVLPAA